MNANKILLPAVTGTSLMTLFSYLVSKCENENFSEPELLAAMEKYVLPATAKPLALPCGWLTHYGIGILLTSIHKQIHQTNTTSVFKNGMVLGGWTGIAGIAMWKLCFRLHPAPPQIPVRTFFKQLLWAHLVFGISVSATSRYVNVTK